MVEIVPFRGLLYNEEKSGPLSDLVAPPYDVIRPEMQEALYAKNPYNVVRLILGKQKEGDTPTDSRYTRAAVDFQDWRAEGILQEDPKPGFYVYSQEYTFNGLSNNRIGFFARVKLEEFNEGNICPHEFTLSKAKKDRAQLIRACRANFSPVFGLYSDPEGLIDRKLTEIFQSQPLAEIEDGTVVNRLWRLNDPAVIHFISEQFTRKKVFIADGHHRYETSLDYFKEHGAEVPDSAHVLMFLTNLDAQSLAIYPIHRQAKCPTPLNREKFLEQLAPFFNVEPVKAGGSADLIMDRLEEAGKKRISFCVYLGGDDTLLLQLRDTKNILPYLKPDEPEELQVLDVCQLHVLVFRHLMGIDTKNPDHQQFIGYNVRPQETMDQVDEGRFDLAVYMNATQIQQVRELAEKGIRLPQKATYFYPKLLSGLVINPFRS